MVTRFVLYLLLLKATVTTFSGLASRPVLREDLVVNRHALTDEQLNVAIVVTRTTPGLVGLYVVSVGYFAGGIPGAIAGWAAMVTPARPGQSLRDGFWCALHVRFSSRFLTRGQQLLAGRHLPGNRRRGVRSVPYPPTGCPPDSAAWPSRPFLRRGSPAEQAA